MFFDEDSERWIYDRAGMLTALASLWVCADYLCRMYERAMFSGPCDDMGYRQPGSHFERAMTEEYCKSVRRAAVILSKKLGATAVESEGVRQQQYSVSFADLYKAAHGHDLLRMLEQQMAQERSAT